MRTHPQRPTRPGLSSIIGVACGVLLASSVAATEFRGGQHVVVAADEVVRDDLYATGETVTVDGRVEGDLIVVAREVRLNGEVTGDLIVAGQAVVVDGPVGDDVRIAGMVLQLGPEGSVGDDVIAAGLSLETKAESLTRGSLFFSGFQASLAGDVEEALRGSMSGLEVRGGIGADSQVEVAGNPGAPSFLHFIPAPVALPAVAGGLTVADTARIEGELEYTSTSEARGDGAASARLTRREPASKDEEAGTSSWQGRLFKWLGLFVLGLLFIWWIPGWLSERSGEIRDKPLALAGIGLLGVAVLPFAIVLALAVPILLANFLGLLKLSGLAALVVVLGIAGALGVVLVFWLTATYLAPLVVGLCTGRWALQRFTSGGAAGLALPLVAGLVALALLRLVPYLGGLVAFLVLLLGWGAVLLWLWRRFRQPSTQVAEAAS